MKGSKQERRPGVWRLRVFVGDDPVTGSKRFVSETFRGKERQAEIALSRLVVKVSEGEHGNGKTMTVAGLLTAFCDHSERIGRSPTTVAEYRRLARNLDDGIGRRPLAKLRPQDLDALYGVLGSRGVPGGKGPLSAASVNRYHDLLRAACKQAVRWGWLEASPVARATPPSEPRAKVTAPSPVELRQLIEKAAASKGPANALLIALAAMTGARRGELCGLRWSDVDLEAGVVHIRRAVKQVGSRLILGDTKTHAERASAVSAGAVELLRRYRLAVDEQAARKGVQLAPDPYLFSPKPDHGRPCKPDSVSQAFRRIADDLGLPFHLHQLRHFAATQGFGAGYDPVSVAAMLGHSDPSLTMRTYAHAIGERQRSLANDLGAIVAPELTEGEA